MPRDCYVDELRAAALEKFSVGSGMSVVMEMRLDEAQPSDGDEVLLLEDVHFESTERMRLSDHALIVGAKEVLCAC